MSLLHQELVSSKTNTASTKYFLTFFCENWCTILIQRLLTLCERLDADLASFAGLLSRRRQF